MSAYGEILTLRRWSLPYPSLVWPELHYSGTLILKQCWTHMCVNSLKRATENSFVDISRSLCSLIMIHSVYWHQGWLVFEYKQTYNIYICICKHKTWSRCGNYKLNELCQIWLHITCFIIVLKYKRSTCYVTFILVSYCLNSCYLYFVLLPSPTLL